MRVVIVGAGGKLGTELVRQAADAGHEVVALTRGQWDITCGEPVSGDVVFNCAAYTRVDDAEREPERAFAVNRDGAARLASQCRRLVHFSTDYVFEGTSAVPYTERDEARPVNVYGESKLAGERAVLAYPGHLVVRSSWLFGGTGPDFVKSLSAGARVVEDQRGRPTWVGHLARVALELASLGMDGLYHYADGPDTTWHGFAEVVLGGPVEAIRSDELGRAARRPAYSVLDCARVEAVLGRPVSLWLEGLSSG